MSPIPALTAGAPALERIDLSPAVGQPVSLEERMINAVAGAAMDAGQRREAILRAGNNPAIASDPAALFQLQLALSNYQLEMSLTSTLSRKAVGCVETLIKAQ